MTKSLVARLAVALVAVGLIAVGPVALVAPDVGGTMFGIPASSPEARAYLWAAATRDAAIGGVLLALLALGARWRVVAACVAVVALIPVGDAIDVYAYAGLRSGAALAVHTGSIVLIAILAAWLWRLDQGS